jgi:hypothetical protein
MKISYGSFSHYNNIMNKTNSFIKNKKLQKKINNNSFNYNINLKEKNDLKENECDNYNDLKNKNNKLRNLLNKANNKINELNTLLYNIELNNKKEKEIIINKLNQISKNYLLYANSYSENLNLKNNINNLNKINYQNNKVINNFCQNISNLLNDYIKFHNKIENFLNEIKNNNDNKNYIFNFFFEIKNYTENILLNYKKEIDVINFPNFYDKYFNYIVKFDSEKNKNDFNIIDDNEMKIKLKKNYSMSNIKSSNKKKENLYKKYNYNFKKISYDNFYSNDKNNKNDKILKLSCSLPNFNFNKLNNNK